MLTKKTELGAITISEYVFLDLLDRSVKETGSQNRIWAATERGKTIAIENKFWDSDLSKFFRLEQDEDGFLTVECNVIVKFGVSIHQVTKAVADRFQALLQQDMALTVKEITINIAGVRSRKIARRHTKVVYRYATYG